MSGPGPRANAAWAVRGRLSPTGRRRVRACVDPLLRPVGSVARVANGEGLVGLTFDDGPDPAATPAVLEVLAAHDVRATFFLLSERAEAAPDVVRAIGAAGHEIALHGVDHQRLTMLGSRAVLDQVRGGRRRLERIAARPVRLFRPAGGGQSLRTWALTRLAGLDVVVWSAEAEDWLEQTPADVVERALARSEAGTILLLHDGLVVPPWSEDPVPTFDRAAIVDGYLGGLTARGLTAVPVGELVRRGRVHRTAWFRP